MQSEAVSASAVYGTQADFRASAEALQQMRRGITPHQVVWGEVISSYEVGRRCAPGLTEAGWIETEGL